MRVGLIGTGMVADMHVQAIEQTGGAVTLAGVCSRDAANARIFAARHGGLRCYNSSADMARDESLNFVILATPPNARAEIANQMSAARKPVLMEKPIERSYDAARQIVETFRAANVPLGVVLQHRARPAARQLMKLLAEDRLGQIAMVDVRIPWWRDQSYYDEPGRGTTERDGGGVLITQAIHTLDLMLQLAGPVTAVQALTHRTRLHRLEAEDFASAGLEFASGAVGSVMATTAAFPGASEEITLHCEKGAASLTASELRVAWRSGQNESFGAPSKTGAGANPMQFEADWHSDIISDFARCISGGLTPMATGRSALMVHGLIDAIQMSSKQRQRVIMTPEEIDV